MKSSDDSFALYWMIGDFSEYLGLLPGPIRWFWCIWWAVVICLRKGLTSEFPGLSAVGIFVGLSSKLPILISCPIVFRLIPNFDLRNSAGSWGTMGGEYLLVYKGRSRRSDQPFIKFIFDVPCSVWGGFLKTLLDDACRYFSKVCPIGFYGEIGIFT